MANKIGNLKDSGGNIVYPVALESCIYDEDNISLKNKLVAMKKEVNDLISATNSSLINWVKSLDMPNLTDGTAHTYTGSAVVVKSYISSDKKTWWREYSDGFKIFKTEGTTDWTLSYYELPVSFGSLTFSDTNYFAIADYVATYLESSTENAGDRVRRYIQSWSAPITSRAKDSLNALIRGDCTYVICAYGY